MKSMLSLYGSSGSQQSDADQMRTTATDPTALKSGINR